MDITQNYNFLPLLLAISLCISCFLKIPSPFPDKVIIWLVPESLTITLTAGVITFAETLIARLTPINYRFRLVLRNDNGDRVDCHLSGLGTGPVHVLQAGELLMFTVHLVGSVRRGGGRGRGAIRMR